MEQRLDYRVRALIDLAEKPFDTRELILSVVDDGVT